MLIIFIMLYIKVLVFIYLIRACLYILMPSSNSPSTQPLLWKPQIWSHFLWVCLLVCLVLKYSWPTKLWYFLMHNIMIQYFHTFWNDHHNKYHLSQRYYIIIDYISHAIHFISMIHFSYATKSVYLSVSLTYFSHPSTHLPSGNHLFVLCLYDSVPVLLCLWFFEC